MHGLALKRDYFEMSNHGYLDDSTLCQEQAAKYARFAEYNRDKGMIDLAKEFQREAHKWNLLSMEQRAIGQRRGERL